MMFGWFRTNTQLKKEIAELKYKLALCVVGIDYRDKPWSEEKMKEYRLEKFGR